MSITVSYVETGRTEQKARTRSALIEAARVLLARGITPTVEQAAEEASISRATAYRYFPNRRALTAAAYPQLEQQSLLGDDPPEDVERRLDLAVDEIIRLTLDTEPHLRATLRLSLEPGDDKETPLRGGRRIVWVADALSPLRDRMPRRELDRLVLGIATVVGIDALVWMTDVAGLSRERAAEQMRWTARTLLRAALGS